MKDLNFSQLKKLEIILEGAHKEFATDLLDHAGVHRHLLGVLEAVLDRRLGRDAALGVRTGRELVRGGSGGVTGLGMATTVMAAALPYAVLLVASVAGLRVWARRDGRQAGDSDWAET